MSAARSVESNPDEKEQIVLKADDVPQPGYFDEGITSYIVEWGAELGDDDQERSLQRAHRLWWNSGLERYQFHNAMKAARHVTLARMANGQVGGQPMAYFFGVLAGAAADACVKAGRPLPRGWELTADDGEEPKPVHRGRAAAAANS